MFALHILRGAVFDVARSSCVCGLYCCGGTHGVAELNYCIFKGVLTNDEPILCSGELEPWYGADEVKTDATMPCTPRSAGIVETGNRALKEGVELVLAGGPDSGADTAARSRSFAKASIVALRSSA